MNNRINGRRAYLSFWISTIFDRLTEICPGKVFIVIVDNGFVKYLVSILTPEDRPVIEWIAIIVVSLIVVHTFKANVMLAIFAMINTFLVCIVFLYFRPAFITKALFVTKLFEFFGEPFDFDQLMVIWASNVQSFLDHELFAWEIWDFVLLNKALFVDEIACWFKKDLDDLLTILEVNLKVGFVDHWYEFVAQLFHNWWCR